MKFSSLAAVAALALAGLAAPAFAQAPAAGAKIYGSDGAEVGTVVRVEGGNVVVDTGTLTAALPADAFASSDKGATIAVTKAELEAAINAANSEAQAKLDAALVTGAEVYSADAVLLGTIESFADDGSAIVELSSGPASLPRAQMAMSGDKLTFRATAADVQAAAQAAQGGD